MRGDVLHVDFLRVNMNEAIQTTVVIDLGFDRGEPDTYASPSRSTVPIWFAPQIIGRSALDSTS